MRVAAKAVVVAAVVLVALGAVGWYGIRAAPPGTDAVEAVRVALDPRVAFAVLEVEGMT